MLAAIEAGAIGAMAPPRARHVAAVTAGNALEFYDFLTYTFFAAQIGRTFFPSGDASLSLLASLATFFAGFLMRPVGAWVIGRVGDRAGRKPAMLLSFSLMGAAIVGLALTPAYATIGVAAPTLAILFRMVQGFALGGEVGPNTAYLVEAAPSHRRGLYVAFQYMSQDLSILVSGVVGYVLAANLSDAQLDAWGWRAAFLLGAVIVPFGLILRRELAETLHVEPSNAAEEQPASFARVAGLGLMMLTGGTIMTYGLTYLNTYSTQTLHMATKTGFLSTITIGVAGLTCDLLGGWLSDKFGRKPIMIGPWAMLLVLTIPGFQALSLYRTAGVLVVMTLLLQSAQSIATSSVLVSVTESLPRRIRCGSIGLIYALAISTFGGSAQFIFAWLTRITGNPLAPAWYMTGAVMVGLVAMLLVRETAPVRLKLRQKG